MANQSLPAQLLRMLALLVVVLAGVHQSPWLLNALAEQAMNSGCHQQEFTTSDHSAHHSHGHHHKGHH